MLKHLLRIHTNGLYRGSHSSSESLERSHIIDEEFSLGILAHGVLCPS